MSEFKKNRFLYGQTGVDVDIEAKAARILFQASQESWANRVGDLGEIIMPHERFSSLRYFDVGGLPEGTVTSGGADGIATKAIIIARAHKFDTAGLDLLAMVCDDAVIRGGEPVEVISDLSVNTLGQDDSRLPIIEELAKGYVTAAKRANVAILNGEIAQLNDLMGRLEGFRFTWSASARWYAHRSRLLDGFAVQEGDYIVGLNDPGFRCNGISSPRQLFEKYYGPKWGDYIWQGHRLVDLLLTPSVIFTPAVVEMFGGWNLKREPQAKLHGAAHITGSGIDKLKSALAPSGLGSHIDNPFAPNPLMLHCQDLANNTDQEAYRTWHMGNAMMLISPKPEDVIKVARKHNIEAKIIGQIIKDPRITIKSQGIDRGTLTFIVADNT